MRSIYSKTIVSVRVRSSRSKLGSVGARSAVDTIRPIVMSPQSEQGRVLALLALLDEEVMCSTRRPNPRAGTSGDHHAACGERVGLMTRAAADQNDSHA